MGGSACNGWRFWTLASDAEKAKKAAPKKTAKKKAGPMFEPIPDQGGAPEGQTRYFCNGCMASFDAPQGVEPIGCPEGHKSEA